MKKVLLAVLALIAVVVLGVVVAASMQPKEYRLERSVVTTANPGAVYVIMCDLNRFKDWSPFLKLDPNSKVAVEGPACAPGQTYVWDGNDDAGAGKMTTVATVPNESVAIKLEFTRPMPDTADTSWTVKSEGGQNRIVWEMHGANGSLMQKVFSMLFMEKMMGPMFDEGLASLKKLAEASSF